MFGAGVFYGLKNKPKPGDLVIAADGGMAVLEHCGIHADVVLGDFDSAPLEKAEEESKAGAELARLSETKDRSDSAAALLLGEARGYRRFYLYGCTGGRLDHTLASIQDLAALSKRGHMAYLFDQDAVLTALTDGTLVFPEGMRGTVSVFSHSDVSSGVRESGLKYIVAEHRLENTFPLGLSNEFTKLPASISVGEGTLIIYASLSACAAG